MKNFDQHSKCLKNFLNDQGGSTLPLVALLLVTLCGASVFAVDLSYAFLTRSQLLTIAEASALSAAAALPDQDGAIARALTYGTQNQAGTVFQNSVTTNDVEFGIWDSDTRVFTAVAQGGEADAIRINATLTNDKSNAIGSLFGSVFGHDEFEIAAAAVAGLHEVSDGGDCLIALAPTGSSTLHLDSNALVTLLGCGIYVNSDAYDALTLDSNAEIQSADHICIRGGYVARSHARVNPAPKEVCQERDDPFADLVEPVFGGCDFNNLVINGLGVTLDPGVYCGGIEVRSNSDVTFSPGVYIVQDGLFHARSNVVLSGNGVGFFLTGIGATLDFDSNTEITFSAPTAGSMAGVIFFQDRDDNGTSILNSNVVNELSGAVYFPNGDLIINSNSLIGAGARCTQIIAGTIHMDSNGGLTVDADLSQCPGGWPGSSTGTRDVVTLLQ